MVFIIIGVVVLLIALYLISTRNSLVVLRNKVRDQWSQIDIQLKKRYDLVPNLVETVKGYTKHEKETLEEIVELRNKCQSAGNVEDNMKANAELSKAVNKIFALAEAYPELKANENFINLQNELKEIEDKISYARQFYNDSILKYNNKIELFPSNIVASMFHFEKEKFFEAGEQERETVQVKF